MILVDDGAFESLFKYGDLSDVKRWFEGKGKALQFKNINSTGMHWQGVPVIITNEDYHAMFQQETYLKVSYYNQSDERHDKTEIKVASIEKELTKLKSRKDPKKLDKDTCMKLIKGSYYNSCCPCCGEETEVWEIDHFYDSSKNRLSEIWPVCKPCNQKLGTGGDLKKGSFRKDHEIKFELFQQLLMNQNKPNVIQTKLF